MNKFIYSVTNFRFFHDVPDSDGLVANLKQIELLVLSRDEHVFVVNVSSLGSLFFPPLETDFSSKRLKSWNTDLRFRLFTLRDERKRKALWEIVSPQHVHVTKVTQSPKSNIGKWRKLPCMYHYEVNELNETSFVVYIMLHIFIIHKLLHTPNGIILTKKNFTIKHCV